MEANINYPSVQLFKDQILEYRLESVNDRHSAQTMGKLTVDQIQFLSESEGGEKRFVNGVKACIQAEKKRMELHQQQMEEMPWIFKFMVWPWIHQTEILMTMGKPFSKMLAEIVPKAVFKMEGRFGFRCHGTAGPVSYHFSLELDVEDTKWNKGHYWGFLPMLPKVMDSARNPTVAFIQLDYVTLQWPERSLWEKEQQGQVALSFLWKLYERDDSKDVTIVGSNGAEVKCHGVILEGHSPVFAATLNPKHQTKESQLKEVDLSEFSEGALKLTVQYLYMRNICTETISCALSLELLELAHRYELQELKVALVAVIMSQGLGWFTPDMVLEFYFFVRNIQEFEALKNFMLDAMETIPDEIRSCERFRQLPTAEANDLPWLLLQFRRAKRTKLDQ